MGGHEPVTGTAQTLRAFAGRLSAPERRGTAGSNTVRVITLRESYICRGRSMLWASRPPCSLTPSLLELRTNGAPALRSGPADMPRLSALASANAAPTVKRAVSDLGACSTRWDPQRQLTQFQCEYFVHSFSTHMF